jgi:hypothetical protein
MAAAPKPPWRRSPTGLRAFKAASVKATSVFEPQSNCHRAALISSLPGLAMAVIVYNNIPHDPGDLTDNLSNFALGQFMTAWSQVEAITGFIFSELCGAPYETARIIIDEVPAKDRITILERLAAIADDATSSVLSPLLLQMVVLAQRRNRIVRAGWGMLSGKRARFWHGLTSADFDQIVNETPKGQSLRAKSIFTIDDMSKLTS